MLKTLARKELRELLPMIVVAIVMQLYFVCAATGMRLGPFAYGLNGGIPFVSEQLSSWFSWVAGGLAVVLGLWQTLVESNRGTLQFLLHRPMARDLIFGTKLFVGAVATLLVALLGVGCYSLWAATPGTHASPFQWAMTSQQWQLSSQMPLIYFGAFLSGLRPGRWFGSRLLPLASGAAAAYVFQLMGDWWWAVLPACLAAEACFVLVILDVGRNRDFS